jgi:serine protease Do
MERLVLGRNFATVWLFDCEGITAESIMSLSKLQILLTGLCLSSTIATAWAGDQTLPGKKRWLAVASTQDLDEAKGIAKSYSWKGAKIMSSQSGWYAVVLGPFNGTSLDALRKVDDNFPDVPKDALLSRGDKYIDVVFDVPASESNKQLVNYDKDKPAHLSSGNLNVDVVMTGDVDNPGPTEITGTENAKIVFSFKTSSDFSPADSNAGFLKLDPDTELPQLVVTRFTGGAHCCTTTYIITKPKGAAAWTMIDGGTVDGGGYSFEDLDGDGVLEITGVDNSFLYAFDSYAGSMAPQKIMQLRCTVVNDVTQDGAFKSQAKQDLAGMEFNTKLGNDLWHANGFLAAWVAKKIQQGDGDAAWDKMLASFDENSGFEGQICTSGQTTENCPADKLETVSFPKSLAGFLSDKNYGPLPAAAQKELQ